MKAYHNDPAIKAKYIARMEAHIEADEIIQGTGYENGEGCAVGCTLNNYEHKAFETELGIPESLAWLEDDLFEACKDREEGGKFALDFLEAIPVGKDLSLVEYEFTLWLLKDKVHGVYQYADVDSRKAINVVAKLLQRKIAGVNVRKSSWANAAAAGYTAGYTAAADGASVACVCAVNTAADASAAYADATNAAYAYAATNAAYAAAETADASAGGVYAARDISRAAQRNKLLQLLNNKGGEQD